jgi:hypothetical protein
MSFSYISRCGNCSSQSLFNKNDICNLPKPDKYSMCYQKTYSSYSPGCEPGYDITCDYNIEGSRTLLCCPNMKTTDNLLDMKCNENTCYISISYQNRKLECSSATSLISCLNNPDSTYINGIKNDFSIPWLIYPKEIYNGLKDIAGPCGGLDDYNCLPYSELYNTDLLTDIDGLCPSGILNNYAYFNKTPSCSLLETKGKCTRTSTSCPTGTTQMSSCTNSDGSILCCTMPNSECYSLASFIPETTTEKNVYCQMTCPSYKDQLFIGVDNPCDSAYYDLCKKSGCPIDTLCESKWNLQQIDNGLLMPDGKKISMPNRLPTVISLKNIQH